MIRLASAIRVSSRAREAPRQKWLPLLKAMWWLGVRVMSKLSDRSNSAGSRLAEASSGVTIAPRRDGEPVQGDVLGGVGWFGAPDGAGVAQDLLDRAVDELGMLAQASELVGVGQQGGDAVGDQVVGGFVAGGDQQEHHRDDLVVGQAVAVLARVDQSGHDVGAGVGAAALDQPTQILDQPFHTLGRALQAVSGDPFDQQLDVVVELWSVLVGHPHHLVDHRDGDRQGVGLLQVDALSGLEAVEQPAGQRLDPVPDGAIARGENGPRTSLRSRRCSGLSL